MLVSKKTLEEKYYLFCQTMKSGRNLLNEMKAIKYKVKKKTFLGFTKTYEVNVFGEGFLHNKNEDEIFKTLVDIGRLSVVNYNLIDFFLAAEVDGHSLFIELIRLADDNGVEISEEEMHLINFMAEFNEETYEGFGIVCPPL